MSSPVPARPDAPHGTRQLLEELDALMKRMLAVPVNELGDTREAKDNAAQATETAAISPHSPPLSSIASEPETPSPVQRASATTDQALRPHQPAPELPAPDRQKAEVPVGSAVPGPGEVPLGGFWPHPALKDPHLREGTVPQSTAPPHWSPPPGQQSPQSLVRPTPTAHRPATGWWLNSLLWSNRSFDHCTASLGGPGRWLQGGMGRRLLGWLGIGLLAGSLAWGLSNWFDWTW